MKKYVKEIANDVMRVTEPSVKKGWRRHPGADGISKVLRLCEIGAITDIEAVRAILQIDSENDEEDWAV